jgi:hypothetical protein
MSSFTWRCATACKYSSENHFLFAVMLWRRTIDSSFPRKAGIQGHECPTKAFGHDNLSNLISKMFAVDNRGPDD